MKTFKVAYHLAGLVYPDTVEVPDDWNSPGEVILGKLGDEQVQLELRGDQDRRGYWNYYQTDKAQA